MSGTAHFGWLTLHFVLARSKVSPTVRTVGLGANDGGNHGLSFLAR